MKYLGLVDSTWEDLSTTLTFTKQEGDSINSFEYNNTFSLSSHEDFETKPSIMIGPDWVSSPDIEHAYSTHEVTMEITLWDGQTVNTHGEMIDEVTKIGLNPEHNIGSYVTTARSVSTDTISQLGDKFAISTRIKFGKDLPSQSSTAAIRFDYKYTDYWFGGEHPFGNWKCATTGQSGGCPHAGRWLEGIVIPNNTPQRVRVPVITGIPSNSQLTNEALLGTSSFHGLEQPLWDFKLSLYDQKYEDLAGKGPVAEIDTIWCNSDVVTEPNGIRSLYVTVEIPATDGTQWGPQITECTTVLSDEPESLINLIDVYELSYDRNTNTLFGDGKEVTTSIELGESSLVALNIEINSSVPDSPTADINVYVDGKFEAGHTVDYDEATELIQSLEFSGNISEFSVFSDHLTVSEIENLNNSSQTVNEEYRTWRSELSGGSHIIYKFTTPYEIDMTNANPVSLYTQGKDISFETGDATGWMQKRVLDFHIIPTAHNCNRVKSYIDTKEMTQDTLPSSSLRYAASSSPGQHIVELDEEAELKKEIATSLCALSTAFREKNGEANSKFADLGWYAVDAGLAIWDLADFGIIGCLKRGAGSAWKRVPTPVRKPVNAAAKATAKATAKAYRKWTMSVSSFWRLVARVIDDAAEGGQLAHDRVGKFIPERVLDHKGRIVGYQFPHTSIDDASPGWFCKLDDFGDLFDDVDVSNYVFDDMLKHVFLFGDTDQKLCIVNRLRERMGDGDMHTLMSRMYTQIDDVLTKSLDDVDNYKVYTTDNKKFAVRYRGIVHDVHVDHKWHEPDKLRPGNWLDEFDDAPVMPDDIPAGVSQSEHMAKYTNARLFMREAVMKDMYAAKAELLADIQRDISVILNSKDKNKIKLDLGGGNSSAETVDTGLKHFLVGPTTPLDDLPPEAHFMWHLRVPLPHMKTKVDNVMGGAYDYYFEIYETLAYSIQKGTVLPPDFLKKYPAIADLSTVEILTLTNKVKTQANHIKTLRSKKADILLTKTGADNPMNMDNMSAHLRNTQLSTDLACTSLWDGKNQKKLFYLNRINLDVDSANPVLDVVWDSSRGKYKADFSQIPTDDILIKTAAQITDAGLHANYGYGISYNWKRRLANGDDLVATKTISQFDLTMGRDPFGYTANLESAKAALVKLSSAMDDPKHTGLHAGLGQLGEVTAKNLNPHAIAPTIHQGWSKALLDRVEIPGKQVGQTGSVLIPGASPKSDDMIEWIIERKDILEERGLAKIEVSSNGWVSITEVDVGFGPNVEYVTLQTNIPMEDATVFMVKPGSEDKAVGDFLKAKYAQEVDADEAYAGLTALDQEIDLVVAKEVTNAFSKRIFNQASLDDMVDIANDGAVVNMVRCPPIYDANGILAVPPPRFEYDDMLGSEDMINDIINGTMLEHEAAHAPHIISQKHRKDTFNQYENYANSAEAADLQTFGIDNQGPGIPKSTKGKFKGTKTHLIAEAGLSRMLSTVRNIPFVPTAMGTTLGIFAGMQAAVTRAPAGQKLWHLNYPSYLNDITGDPANTAGYVPLEQFYDYYEKFDFVWPGIKWLDYGAAGIIEMRRSSDHKVYVKFKYTETMVMVGMDVSDELPDIQDVIDEDVDFMCISNVQYEEAQKSKYTKAAWLHDCHHDVWMKTADDGDVVVYPTQANLDKATAVGRLHPDWKVYTVKSTNKGGTTYRKVYISPEGYVRPLGERFLLGMNYTWE